MNENKFTLHIFSERSSTDIGFFPIYFSIHFSILKKRLEAGYHWNQGIQNEMIVIGFLLRLGPHKHVSIPFASKKKFWASWVSYTKQEVKMPQNHHFCWRQHEKQPTRTYPEFFLYKGQIFRWLKIFIPIFIAIACILRK